LLYKTQGFVEFFAMESYMQISNLMHITGFWTNLHQVRSDQNI